MAETETKTTKEITICISLCPRNVAEIGSSYRNMVCEYILTQEQYQLYCTNILDRAQVDKDNLVKFYKQLRSPKKGKWMVKMVDDGLQEENYMTEFIFSCKTDCGLTNYFLDNNDGYCTIEEMLKRFG